MSNDTKTLDRLSDLTTTTAEDDIETITRIDGEHGSIWTNGPVGGWVQQKDGSYISVQAAKEMNRAQRRKLGISL